MNRIHTIFLTILVVALFVATGAIAQDAGDFRSAADGDWSAAATWETFDGSSWVAAGSSPNGSEMITIQGTNTVSIDVAVSITGTVTVEGEGPAAGGLLQVTGGSFTVADGGTYEHARDAGSVPIGTWEVGSTILFTGILADDPDNSDQSFHHLTWNNPGQVENINIGWDAYTLGGDLTVLHTNGKQFRMTSASDAPRVITINGSVIVDGENAEFTTTGSGSLADYEVTVMGNVEVINGGFLSASRGSSGQAIWFLYGDLTVNNGRLGDSSDHEQEKSFVFAADTTAEGAPSQNVSVTNISYDGPVHFFVSNSSGIYVDAASEFFVDASLVNEGLIEVDADGQLVFGGEATYEHAQDGGTIPTSTWNVGSTALFTGIVTSGPGNASQDFFNLVLDSPGNIENNDFDMDGNTIHGDIHVLSTGSARLYLTNPDSFEDRVITIMGDLYVDAGNGAFTTQGTGSGESSVTIHHHGNITVDSGNFSIGRGSGPIVHWYMYEGHFIFNAGKTQNSNPRSGSAFIFTGQDSTQILDVSEDVEISHLPFTVDTSATLDIRDSNFSGMSDNIELRSGGNLATSFAAGFEDNLGAENLSLSSEAGYILNGTVEQQTGFNLPLTVASLTIDNASGVIQSRDITITEFLRLSSGVFDNTNGFTLGTNAEIIFDGGSLLIPVDSSGEPLPIPEPPYAIGDTLNYNGSFSFNTELGNTEADAWLIQGTEGSSWEIVDDSADEDDRALAFTVAHVGTEWHTNQAVNEPINVVEGEQYRASIYLKGDTDGRLVRFYAGVPGEGGWERVRGWDTPELELTTTWTMYDFDFTATADHETYGMRLATEFNTDVNDGGIIYIDDAVLEKIEPVSNEIVEGIPDSFSLEQNYPNPFNPTTNIQYNLPEQAHVSLKVYDITGREVAALIDNNMNAGSHTIEWDASNLASGVYLYRISAGNFTSVRKLTILK